MSTRRWLRFAAGCALFGIGVGTGLRLGATAWGWVASILMIVGAVLALAGRVDV